jgi:hypothetical protein
VGGEEALQWMAVVVVVVVCVWGGGGGQPVFTSATTLDATCAIAQALAKYTQIITACLGHFWCASESVWFPHTHRLSHRHDDLCRYYTSRHASSVDAATADGRMCSLAHCGVKV